MRGRRKLPSIDPRDRVELQTCAVIDHCKIEEHLVFGTALHPKSTTGLKSTPTDTSYGFSLVAGLAFTVTVLVTVTVYAILKNSFMWACRWCRRRLRRGDADVVLDAAEEAEGGQAFPLREMHQGEIHHDRI
jgi:hypothetical protein